MTLRTIFGAAAVAASLLTSTYAAAAYPEKPITFIVGFSPGGTADGTARMLADLMSKDLGQPIVVENRAGANGNIATSHVARQAPDGYTLFITSIGHTVNPWLSENVNYDPVKDFTAVGRILTAPNLMVVPASSPFNNVQEVIAFAKENPGKLNMASSGTGTSVHLSGELFQKLAGVEFTHIPYKGTGSAMPDLLSGVTQVMFPNLPSALPQVRGGNLKAMGVTSADRFQGASDIPTIEEGGVPGYDLSTWYGMIGPAGMDAAVVEQLNASLQKALSDPAVQESMLKRGSTAAPGSPGEFEAFLEAESKKWSQLIKDANIKAN